MLIFPAKQIRAQVIAEYANAAGYRGVVAFSCGNATRELRAAGLWVLDISPSGDIAPTGKWWTPAEIHRAFPDLFDATSGHLPAWMMIEIGKRFREYLGDIEGGDVPSGSGETIMCLRWAYPDKIFRPVYNLDKATEYNDNSPLNYLVNLCNTVKNQ